MTEQSGVATNLSIQDTRKALVSLYVTGSKTDAQAMFFAIQGATQESWENFERILDPVNRFVIMGELPYVGRTVFAEPDGEGLTPPADPDWSQSSNSPGQTPAGDTQAPGGNSSEVSSSMSATELIALARGAQTEMELAAIEQAANGRVTVLDAVDIRREELAAA
jgi:hypothetical protein